MPCGDLLARILKIPLVYSLRFFPGSTHEKYSGGLPLPPSYVPAAMSEQSDRMTFMERLRNVINVLCFDFWFQMFNEKWNQLYIVVLVGALFCWHFCMLNLLSLKLSLTEQD
jgi:glucuronosyltransferase